MRIPQFRLRTLMIVIVFVALVLTVAVQSVLLHRQGARSAEAEARELMLRAQAEMHLTEARAAMLHAQAAYQRALDESRKKPLASDRPVSKP